MSVLVTEDIVSNLIKTPLEHLKTFAELLNAEFTEEGHDESNREKFKEDVSRVLDKFGSAEASFRRTLSALSAAKNELIQAANVDVTEECNPQQLMREVDEIINIFEGKSKSKETEPAFEEFDENRIVSQLEKVEDVLNEFNPLKFRDEDDADDDNDDEDPNELEEQRMTRILEQFQKKHMKKHEESMVADDDNDNAMEVDNADDDSTTEDEDEQPSCSRTTQRPSTSNAGAKKQMDEKLKKIWKNYQQQISNVELKPLKEICDKKLSNTTDVPFEQLTHYPKFSKSILELFSLEAIVVCGERQNYIDPFLKVAIQHPIRNMKCGHIYEKDTVCNMIERKKEMGCPNVGCAVKFTVHDLEEDEDLTQKVTQSLNQKHDSQQSTSASVSNAEYLDDTDTEYD